MSGVSRRRIAVQHQHLTVEGLDGGPRGFHRIRRPQLLGLHERRKLRIERRASGDDVVHPWTDHDGGAAEAGALGGGEHMREQRRAGEPVQHLGPVGFHPRAFARGKNDGQSGSVSHAGSDRCQIVSIISANSMFRGGEREGNACGQRIPSFKGESRIAAASSWNPIRLVQSWSEGHNPCGCNASRLGTIEEIDPGRQSESSSLAAAQIVSQALLVSLFRLTFSKREASKAMALHRREGSRNMLRGVLAFFWIALAGVSGVYLYSALANPAALDGQLANPLPVGSGDMTSAFSGSGARDQELAEIKASLRQLTQQMAAISTKLNLDQDALASAEDSADAEAAAEPESPSAPSPEAEKPEVAAAPPRLRLPLRLLSSKRSQPKRRSLTPQPEAKPVEQAAVEREADAAAAEIKPAPKPYEPPAVAVAPIDDLPVEEESETSSDASTPTPPPPAAEPAPMPTPAASPSAPRTVDARRRPKAPHSIRSRCRPRPMTAPRATASKSAWLLSRTGSGRYGANFSPIMPLSSPAFSRAACLRQTRSGG